MAISIVQASNKFRAANVANLAGALNAAPAAGASLIVSIGGYHSTGFDVTSVTDNRSNSYSLAKRSTTGGGGRALIYVAHNVAALTPTITVNPSNASANYLVFGAIEAAGLANPALDVTQSNTGSSTNPSSGTTAATTVANELAVAATALDVNDTNVNLAAQSGWTQRHVEQDATSYIGFSAVDKILSATGAQSHAWTADTSNWSAVIATFKEDPGLAANMQASSTAAASLTTAIRMAAAALAQAGCTGNLTTAIRLLANALSAASFSANFSFFNANLQALATATANLTTAIRMRADAAAISALTAALTTQIRLTAAVVAQTTSSAAFRFEIGRIKADAAFDSIHIEAAMQVLRAAAQVERSIQAIAS